MQLKDLTNSKDSSKNLELFTNDDIKSIDEIKEKMEDYLKKGENIEEEIRKSKSSSSPSIENTIENVKETISESVVANVTKEAFEKISKTPIGKKVAKATEKPIETAKNILSKAGKIVYKLGKTVLTK